MFMCSSNDMAYASEGGIIQERDFKLKAPKPSYEIKTKIEKNDQNAKKVDIQPTKGIFYNTSIIPYWIEITFHSIPKKNGKRITLLHIVNKCLMSKDPFLFEPSVIFYCHENETDLLRIIHFLIDISFQMKCDIISFDYQGFGHSYTNNNKPKMDYIFEDGQEAIDFTLSKFDYKIENLIIMGKDIGAMTGLYLSSKDKYSKCKSLILYNPILNLKKFDEKIMRSINCKCLLIMDFKNKEEIEDNEIIDLFREIPNQQEWFPIKKKKNEKFIGFIKYLNNTFDDVYFRHRSKFIIKLRDYIYPEDEKVKNRKKGSSSIGESTESESNFNLSSNKILNLEDDNEIKDEEKKENKTETKNLFNEPEIQINNNDDY